LAVNRNKSPGATVRSRRGSFLFVGLIADSERVAEFDRVTTRRDPLYEVRVSASKGIYGKVIQPGRPLNTDLLFECQPIRGRGSI
jgi:hypothetical protein